MSPKRIQMSRQRPWREENSDAVICDRRSEFGNPFKIGFRIAIMDASGPREIIVDNAQQSCGLYREWLADRVEICPAVKPSLAYIRAALRGRDLACWCHPDEPWCHLDVLLDLANS